MSNRHLARTLAMQALYQWDFLGQPDASVDDIIEYVRHEFAPDFDDQTYVESTVRGVLDSRTTIDETLATFAKDWPVNQMTIVDRNILRIGVFELLNNDKIPAKVAINEAIEIAKAFGGDTSGKFVNGVLGAVYKDQLKQGNIKEIDKEETVSEDTANNA